MVGIGVYNIVDRVLGGVWWTVLAFVLAALGLLSVPLRRFANRIANLS